MTKHIQAIIFDIGGTLRRTTRRTESEKAQLTQPIQVLIGSSRPALEFSQCLSQRAQAYRSWAEQSLNELNEEDLWTQWMLPDYPAEQIGPLALQLNQHWRDATGIRAVMAQARPVILELFRRGYRLGIASNTVSSTEVPDMLRVMGIAGCFEVILLSCVFGARKHSPAMLLAAAESLGLPPSACVYIGDRPERDVAAARSAGFAQAVLLRDLDYPQPIPNDNSLIPDAFIDSLDELLTFFPARAEHTARSLTDASLSTMWGMKNFDCLEDFLTASGRYGYGYIELNHQVSQTMLEGIDLSRYRFSSIHEPCPTVLSTGELKKRDWLISSSIEETRAQGVASIKRSIDLAHRLNAGVVIMHGGQVSTPQTLENQLRVLFDEGLKGSPEYEAIKARMIIERQAVIRPHFESVKKSLVELLDYAAPLGVCLGLENRYHWTDIPTQDEMEELLLLGSPEQLGFVFDIGHATALDRLGFYPFEGWIKRFSARLVGTHLHDVIGLADHYAPGLGDVNFERLAACLPSKAFRTFELRTSNTAEQVKNGLKYLATKAMVKSL